VERVRCGFCEEVAGYVWVEVCCQVDEGVCRAEVGEEVEGGRGSLFCVWGRDKCVDPVDDVWGEFVVNLKVVR
jgi:hypothetical protein